jgi:hypothetical protein
MTLLPRCTPSKVPGQPQKIKKSSSPIAILNYFCHNRAMRVSKSAIKNSGQKSVENADEKIVISKTKWRK